MGHDMIGWESLEVPALPLPGATFAGMAVAPQGVAGCGGGGLCGALRSCVGAADGKRVTVSSGPEFRPPRSVVARVSATCTWLCKPRRNR